MMSLIFLDTPHGVIPCRLIEDNLFFTPSSGFGNGALHRLRNRISIKDGCAMDMARRAAHRLNQRTLGTQEAFLVSIENGDQ